MVTGCRIPAELAACLLMQSEVTASSHRPPEGYHTAGVPRAERGSVASRAAPGPLHGRAVAKADGVTHPAIPETCPPGEGEHFGVNLGSGV